MMNIHEGLNNFLYIRATVILYLKYVTDVHTLQVSVDKENNNVININEGIISKQDAINEAGTSHQETSDEITTDDSTSCKEVSIKLYRDSKVCLHSTEKIINYQTYYYYYQTNFSIKK